MASMGSEKYSTRGCIVDLEENEKKQTGRFSRTQTFDFIRAYRLHECLWNVGIPQYNDKALRYMAIRSLAKEFHLTMEAVKKKIHALRSTYLQMRDRVHEIDNHEPTLSWYYEMEFLNPVITPRKPIELKRIRTKVPRKRMREDVEPEEEEDSMPQPIQMKIETMPYDEAGNSEQEEVYIEYIEQQREEESCDVQEDDTTTVYSSAPEAGEPPASAAAAATPVAPTTTTQDEFDIFGQSVAAQLKTMPLVHSIPLMGRIQGLITEFRMKSLQSTHK